MKSDSGDANERVSEWVMEGDSLTSEDDAIFSEIEPMPDVKSDSGEEKDSVSLGERVVVADIAQKEVLERHLSG